MGCTRSKSTEISLCEPITSFGWLGSRSSCLDGEWTYPWYCLRTYISANSVWWGSAQENDRYHFTPKWWTKHCPRIWPIKRYSLLTFSFQITTCRIFIYLYHTYIFSYYPLVWATKLLLAAIGLVFPVLVLGYKSFTRGNRRLPSPTRINLEEP